MGQVAIDAARAAAPNAVIALTGIFMGTHTVQADPNAMNNALVMTNSVVVGTVNATYRHYEQGAAALAAADPGWLDRLLTRRVRYTQWTTSLTKTPADIKVVVRLPSG